MDDAPGNPRAVMPYRAVPTPEVNRSGFTCREILRTSPWRHMVVPKGYDEISSDTDEASLCESHA